MRVSCHAVRTSTTSGRQAATLIVPPVRIWIDLSNSPHPLLFAPIARRLEALGHDVVVTARDNAQTVELARRHWPGAAVIGDESPPGRAAKAASLAGRVRRLIGFARAARPSVALSHNSYAQIVAARVAGVPAVTAMDFEYQPSNHLAFRLATTVLLPEVVPADVVRRQGATPAKVVRYPGLKEEIYLGDFAPDGAVLERVYGDDGPGGLTVVARTAPERAIYHPHANLVFADVLRVLGGQPAVRCVVLARHREQRAAVAGLGLANVRVPDRAVDARSLMYAADLVIGAGGTMTREAGLLGVPTFTMFAGRRPAVDAWLEERGLVRRLTDPAQVGRVQPRPGPPRTPDELRERSRPGIDAFVSACLAAA